MDESSMWRFDLPTIGARVTNRRISLRFCGMLRKDKKNARINDAMHRISMALPRYTALGDLMDYISLEIDDHQRPWDWHCRGEPAIDF